MEKIAYSVVPQEQPSFNDWVTEFRVGMLAPKPTNRRAEDMMSLWNRPQSEPGLPEKVFHFTVAEIKKSWYL
jgi:hypothetical protein